MDTLTKSSIATRSSTNLNDGWYRRFIREMETAYFGIVAMSIVIATILGAIALMYIFKNKAPMWQMFLCVALVLSNVIIPVAQQKLKWIIVLFLISASANGLLIAVNAF